MKQTSLTCCAVFFVLAGCADRQNEFELPFSFLGPVALEGGAVFVDRAFPTAFQVRPVGQSFGLSRAEIGPQPVLLERRHVAGETLVLSQGERGQVGKEPQPARLEALSFSDGGHRRYELGSPFNALAQTDDGSTAIAFFREDAELDRLLFNPNEIAIVDLSAAPSDTNPRRRTVRSFGGVPTQVMFSPPLQIGGESRRLAIVLADSYVTLIDLSHPDRSEISVRLTLPEDGRRVRPEQVVVDVESRTLYLRSSGADDIYALVLNEVTPESARGNDFRPSLNQLAAGRAPSDMILFDHGDGPRLLVTAAGSSEAAVIEATSNRVTTIPLGATATKILPYAGPSPRDPEVGPRALLVHDRGGATSVFFVDLEDLEERGTRNVEALNVGRSVSGLIELPDQNGVLLLHPGAAGEAGVTGVDLFSRTASPIFAQVRLENARLDETRSRAWIALAGSDRVGWLDLTTFHPGELRLDASVADVLPLEREVDGRRWVLALHPASHGHLTLLDAADPRRDTAIALEGFLLHDYLKRGDR